MSLLDWAFVTVAVSQVGIIWGLLLIAAGLSALVVLGRAQIAWLAHPVLSWLGLPTPRRHAAVDLEPSGEIPRFVGTALARYRGEHRHSRRRVGMRARSTVCPPRTVADAPTLLLPAVDAGSRPDGAGHRRDM